MKLLVLSDSHLENNIMLSIINHHKNNIDYIIHCGDTAMNYQDSLLENIDIIVKGNHDYDLSFPTFCVFKNILITHGHLYDVYYGYTKLYKLTNENQCTICLHGHTHVPTFQKINDIYFINPGSIMINRGPYGFGTYVILDVTKNKVEAYFYHHETHKEVSAIVLEEGLRTLNEFKKLLK